MRAVDTLQPVTGLKVLVTGGASGIGATIAEAFHEAGSRVHICDVDRTAVNAFTAQHRGVSASLADVSLSSEVDRVIHDVSSAMGGLDVLINNAGIAGPTNPIEDIDALDWERTVAVNLNGQFYFARRAVPLLKQSKACPCLIAMSSVAGRLGYKLRAPYAATKWAIVGLTKSLAIELGPYDIRVNAILPGVVEGERMERVIKSRAVATGSSIEQTRDEYLKKISLRRMVTSGDVAAMALFLCSYAARNITGQAISVDGNVEYL